MAEIDQQEFFEADLTTGMDIFTTLYVDDMNPVNFVNVFYETTADLTTFWRDFFLAWLSGGGDLDDDEGMEIWTPT